ncbi:MAG: hypothetical protein LAT68_13865 [Cyclobacteriaceae bacterium]|nr:hypothetical protein [Cyclobacteriaceae bacterium]MCH8517406.1 hypothetical protein [Cyclobacteriaceae bacterium]
MILTTYLSIGEKRTLIFGSVHGEYFVPIKSTQREELWYTIGAEWYTIRQDDRDPTNSEPESLNHMNLLGSLSFKIHHMKRFSNPKFGWYTNAYFQPNFYSTNKGFMERFRSTECFFRD